MFKFTIDNWLNPYILPNQTRKLPQPLRRFLGGHTPKPVSDHWVWLEILIGTFCGILLLEGVFRSNTVFTAHHVHGILASYGAGAILCFNANMGPLAQPRNVLCGHFVASTIGVGIQRLFALSKSGQDHYYVAGALSVAVLSVVMTILNCVHPPAGASALLPSIDPNIREIGWWYLPVQLVSSVLMISAAAITGNVIRVYPTFWWTSGKVGKQQKQSTEEQEAEKQAAMNLEPLEKIHTTESESYRRDKEKRYGVTFTDGPTIEITKDDILLPRGIQFDELAYGWLETLQRELKDVK